MKKKYLVKTIDKNIIEVEGVMMKTPLKNKPPKWFIDYMSEFKNSINDTIKKEVKRVFEEYKKDS